MTRAGYNATCRFPDVPGSRTVCGTVATHEVTYDGPGSPIPACPRHRVQAALDVTRSVSIRRLRLR